MGDIEDWLKVGLERGYCTHVACLTHSKEDLYTYDEADHLLDGEDPCAFAVRLLDA